MPHRCALSLVASQIDIAFIDHMSSNPLWTALKAACDSDVWLEGMVLVAEGLADAPESLAQLSELGCPNRKALAQLDPTVVFQDDWKPVITRMERVLRSNRLDLKSIPIPSSDLDSEEEFGDVLLIDILAAISDACILLKASKSSVVLRDPAPCNKRAPPLSAGEALADGRWGLADVAALRGSATWKDLVARVNTADTAGVAAKLDCNISAASSREVLLAHGAFLFEFRVPDPKKDEPGYFELVSEVNDLRSLMGKVPSLTFAEALDFTHEQPGAASRVGDALLRLDVNFLVQEFFWFSRTEADFYKNQALSSVNGKEKRIFKCNMKISGYRWSLDLLIDCLASIFKGLVGAKQCKSSLWILLQAMEEDLAVKIEPDAAKRVLRFHVCFFTPLLRIFFRRFRVTTMAALITGHVSNLRPMDKVLKLEVFLDAETGPQQARKLFVALYQQGFRSDQGKFADLAVAAAAASAEISSALPPVISSSGSALFAGSLDGVGTIPKLASPALDMDTVLAKFCGSPAFKQAVAVVSQKTADNAVQQAVAHSPLVRQNLSSSSAVDVDAIYTAMRAHSAAIASERVTPDLDGVRSRVSLPPTLTWSPYHCLLAYLPYSTFPGFHATSKPVPTQLTL
jgi:hypothetical protein